MPTPRYYFTRLSIPNMKVYNAIWAGLAAYKSEITLPEMSIDEADKVFRYVLKDNPILFHIDSFMYTTYPGDKCVLKPRYKYPHHVAKKYKEKVLKHLRNFDAAKSLNDFKKECFVHDYCLKHFTYDYSFGEHAHSVLGPVLHNKAVCSGISKFVSLAFDYLDIKCLIVTGDGIDPISGKREPHAWNIVNIDGLTYHLDVTYDICLTTHFSRYDYFNLPDKDIKKDHVIKDDVPPCTTEGQDYYTRTLQVASSPSQLTHYIEDKIRKGQKHIAFKVLNAHGKEDIYDRVLDLAADSYIKIVNRGVYVQVSHNKDQMVIELIFNEQ
ncbi:MAG: hypothetical protein FWE42_01560 [Defluviitaleaceae bacterium]|nr:hypothetical protein [Defluviitaleaceae bacterium]